MQLTLKKVHLRNFRIHTDYVFEPEVHGITAIIGDNGHGKSSIIDGIAWALFGTKPNGGLKNTELRRISAKDDDPCYVTVELLLNGNHTLVVTRSIKSKTVQCECVLDGVLEAGPAVSNADKWIPATLGVDEGGFLSAILVQQKQVGAIVSESASVRQQNIEKLTGITAATRAVKDARDEVHSLRKAISMIAPDASHIGDISGDIEGLNNEIASIARQRDALKEHLITASSDYKEAQEQYNQAKDSFTQHESLSHQYDLVHQQVKDMDARRGILSDKIREMKSTLPTMMDYAPLQHDADDINSKLQTLNTRHQILQSTIAKDVDDQDIAEAKHQLDALVIDDIDEKQTRQRIQDLKAQSTAAAQRIRQYRKSLKSLEHGENATCPTCLQPIDDISHVKQEFERLIDTADHDGETYTAQARQLQQVLVSYQQSAAQHDDLQKRFDDMQTLRNDSVEARKEDAALLPDIKTLEKESRKIANEISDIKANRMIIQTYDGYKKEFSGISNQYDQTYRQSQKLKQQINAMHTSSQRDVSKYETRVHDLQSSMATMRTQAMELKGNNQLAQERLKNAQNELVRAQRQEEERKRIMRRFSVAQASLSVLTAFREHLAKEAVPQITDYASDMVATITDGKFISINMDEKYTITVKRNDGRILDVRMLSGGERDTIAICLRLAISMLLSSGEPSMIILDEVLTAMDDARSGAILTSIQNSGHGQVIIIAHNDIVKQISDKAVLL